MGRLLIVEDDPGFTAFVEAAAEDLGYDVRSVDDGRAVAAACREHAPDVIVMDIVLPGRDGIEVVRDLAERGSKARILLVTGHSPAYLKAAVAIGAACGVEDIAAVQKPVGLAQLREMLS